MRSRESQAKGGSVTPVMIVNTAKPFFREIVNRGAGVQTFGQGVGTFAVTSITLTNYDSGCQRVRIFQPVLSGGTYGQCADTTVSAFGAGVRAIVPGNQTLQLTFPSPIVFPAVDGQTCGAISFQSSNGLVYADISGYSN
jgi:hypothetical protein